MSTEATMHAQRFLRIADPDATALDLLEGVLRWAVTDDEARGALSQLERWTRGQLKQLGVEPAAAVTDDKVLDLLAATSLVTFRKHAENPRALSLGFGRRLVALLAGLEPQFLPELLDEIRRRAAGDVQFANDMARWRQRTVQLQKQSAALRRDIVQSEEFQSPLPSDPPLVMRAQDNSEDIIGVLVIAVVLFAAWLVATAEDRENK